MPTPGEHARGLNSAENIIWPRIPNPASQVYTFHISASLASLNMAEKDAIVTHLEDQPGRKPCADNDAEFVDNFSDEARKKVLRKVSPIPSNTEDVY